MCRMELAGSHIFFCSVVGAYWIVSKTLGFAFPHFSLIAKFSTMIPRMRVKEETLRDSQQTSAFIRFVLFFPLAGRHR